MSLFFTRAEAREAERDAAALEGVASTRIAGDGDTCHVEAVFSKSRQFVEKHELEELDKYRWSVTHTWKGEFMLMLWPGRKP